MPGCPFEQVQPLALQHRDRVAYDTWPCVELRHRRGKEAPTGEGSPLHEGEVPITESVERRDTGRVGQAREDHLVNIDLSGMLDRRQLQVLLGAEVGEESAFAHREVGGESTKGQALETLHARDGRRNLQDSLPSGEAAGGL